MNTGLLYILMCCRRVSIRAMFEGDEKKAPLILSL